MKPHVLSRAAEKAGGVIALCAALDISPRTYRSWRHGVTLGQVPRVAQATGEPIAVIAPSLAPRV